MENRIQNVNLSFCCKKDWNSFQTVDERRRFCGSCQHNVVDFTKATRMELDDALKSGNRVCGRFTRSQMGDKFLKYAASSVVIAVSVLSTGCERPVDVKPADAVESLRPTPPQAPEDDGEFVTMGIVMMPIDSLSGLDTLRITDDEPLK